MNIDLEIIWFGSDALSQEANALGEGPMWHVKEQALYWIDIAKCLLWRLDTTTHECQFWKMEDYIGAVVPRASGGVVVTVGNKVLALDLPAGKTTQLAEITPWNKRLRLNDGKCDQMGRFWMGVADFQKENPQGGLYRLDPDGCLTQMEEGITISNGLGWSPDNKAFYYTDGLRYCIYEYDFDLQKGSLSNRRIFVQLDETPVEPDGLTIDTQGYVWQAHWNAGKVFRYSPNGHQDRAISLPVKRPTSCIFGGPNLDILYVTSCSQGIGETEVLPYPAGALFALDVGVTGRAEPAFAG